MKLILVLLVLLPLAAAHSWVHCTNYDRSGFNDNNYYNPSKCTGFGRGWRRNCEQHNNQFGVDCGFNQLNFNQICPFRLNPSNYFEEYSGKSPMATYQPGQQVCLAWPAKNHVAASCANIFIPDSGTQIFMSGPNPQSDPANLNDLKATRMIADFGRNSRADQYFAFQNCPKFCENNDKCLCTGCFNIPNDVQQGAIYSFYWAWAFNNVAETYTTCWEARIGGNGAPAPAPNPVPNPTPNPNGDPCRSPFNGNGNGLIGEYFRGTNFNNYITERVDPRVSFNYGLGGPAGINNFDVNFWTIRWLGQVQPRFTGDWTFYTISDDGCRLWVKGQMLVNDFNPHGVLQRSGQIFLNAGEKAGIKLEYLEVDQAASVQLQWSHRCEGQQDIPQAQLYATKQIGFDAQCAKYIGEGKGLVANYYNPGSKAVVATQIEGPNQRRPEVLPNVTLQAGWKVEWSGFILPSFNEEYTFFVTSQAGVRLTVNNVTIISNIVPHNSSEDSGKITLAQGNAVPIFLEFWSSDAVNADNNVVLRWFSAICQGEELIAREQFYTTLDEIPTSPQIGFESSAATFVSVISVALFLLF